MVFLVGFAMNDESNQLTEDWINSYLQRWQAIRPDFYYTFSPASLSLKTTLANPLYANDESFTPRQGYDSKSYLYDYRYNTNSYFNASGLSGRIGGRCVLYDMCSPRV